MKDEFQEVLDWQPKQQVASQECSQMKWKKNHLQVANLDFNLNIMMNH